MNEPVDTGFDSVLAGEVWSPDPAADGSRSLPSGEIEPSVTTVSAVAGSPQITATVTTPGLSSAGIQAAKSLVQLPDLGPAQLARLARDFAMDIKERHVILKDNGLSEAQYDFIEANNDFYRAALQAACLEWHAPLSTQERIKVEAAAILEDSLIGLGARMQNRAEGLPGVIEAAKLFAKVAGVGEREVGGAAPGERFTINIDLGGDQKLVVQSTAAPASSAAAGERVQISTDGEE